MLACRLPSPSCWVRDLAARKAVKKVLHILDFVGEYPLDAVGCFLECFPDVHTEVVFFEILVGESRIVKFVENIETPGEAAFESVEGTGQPPSVDGHHEPQPFPLLFVSVVEVRDVLLHPVVEDPFLVGHRHPAGFGTAVGQLGGQ